jgi:hypothetical protein
MFKTKMHKIRKNGSHVLTVRTYRERTKLKDVMRLTRLGEFGAHATLKVDVSSESERIIEVKLQEVKGRKKRRLECPAQV